MQVPSWAFDKQLSPQFSQGVLYKPMPPRLRSHTPPRNRPKHRLSAPALRSSCCCPAGFSCPACGSGCRREHVSLVVEPVKTMASPDISPSHVVEQGRSHHLQQGVEVMVQSAAASAEPCPAIGTTYGVAASRVVSTDSSVVDDTIESAIEHTLWRIADPCGGESDASTPRAEPADVDESSSLSSPNAEAATVPVCAQSQRPYLIKCAERPSRKRGPIFGNAASSISDRSVAVGGTATLATPTLDLAARGQAKIIKPPTLGDQGINFTTSPLVAPAQHHWHGLPARISRPDLPQVRVASSTTQPEGEHNIDVACDRSASLGREIVVAMPWESSQGQQMLPHISPELSPRASPRGSPKASPRGSPLGSPRVGLQWHDAGVAAMSEGIGARPLVPAVQVAGPIVPVAVQAVPSQPPHALQIVLSSPRAPWHLEASERTDERGVFTDSFSPRGLVTPTVAAIPRRSPRLGTGPGSCAFGIARRPGSYNTACVGPEPTLANIGYSGVHGASPTRRHFSL